MTYDWVFTEADQRLVDSHWNPGFYRNTVIETRLYLASLPGAGVPGWDPFFGIDRNSMSYADYTLVAANTFADQVREGRVRPTGLEDDPRLSAPAVGDILDLLRGASVRLLPPTPAAGSSGLVPGTWRSWEIEEIAKEEDRTNRIERAWDRAESAYAAINPTGGDGT
jgi:hypothetical protein